MNDCVAFVVAPYGFGPSSKAIAISSHLPRSIRRVFFGDGPPLELARASRAFSNCTRLDFEMSADAVAEIMWRYRIVVFVNSTRFLGASSQADAAVVFVDTLAWIRGSWPSRMPTRSAYFAQRFFDHAFTPDLESSDYFRPTGAIVAKTLTEPRYRNTVNEAPPIVHCGGLCSPAVRAGADTVFVTHLCEALKEASLPVRVILPRHLLSQFAPYATKYVSFIDCSPMDVGEHIEGSLFALTTSGIEFTYEAALLGVPTLFLPPFNATQLLQLRYYNDAFSGCIPFLFDQKTRRPTAQSLDADTAAIQEEGMCGAWTTQFEALGRYLKRAQSGSFLEALVALQRQQGQAVANVGSDGASTIASHILSEIERNLCVQRTCLDT